MAQAGGGDQTTDPSQHKHATFYTALRIFTVFVVQIRTRRRAHAARDTTQER